MHNKHEYNEDKTFLYLKKKEEYIYDPILKL